MPKFKDEENTALHHYVVDYNNWLYNNVNAPVYATLGLQPQELIDAFLKLENLRTRLLKNPSEEIGPELLPFLKRSILHARRIKASDVEKRSEFTFNHDIRIRLEDELSLLSSVMEQDWFNDTKTAKSPKITDFLSIQRAEESLNQNNLQLSQRTYDEKFHILNAPSLFLSDLAYYRATCELRGVSLCVAYVDIDDFKRFNSLYGEPQVDKDVLPKFMSTLENHIYHHGHAYRFGGDEYAAILPNMSISQAIHFLADFQFKLRQVDYFDITEHTEVSIGIFEVNENSSQTDREIEKLTAAAKNFAKNNGKNCIATYKEQSFHDKDLYVVPTNHPNEIK